MLPIDGMKAYPRTDMGNANLYADMFRDSVRFDKTSGKWLAWDGKRWSRESGETQAQLYARGVSIFWFNKIGDAGDKDERKELYKHWEYVSSATGVKNMLFLVKSEPGISLSGEMLDTHEYLLNVSDGTIDLKTGIIRDHDPNDLITQLAPVEYGKGEGNIGRELWIQCLKDWHPDGEAEKTWDYLQEFAGYCCTGDTSSRCFPIFWGTGKNGKNVFVDTLKGILGDYAGVASRTLVEAEKQDSHPTEVAALWKKRLVLVSEPKKGNKLKTSLVKAMTGDGTLTARFMRQDFFEFKPTHKAVMLTQNLPIIDETTDAIWDRIHKLRWGVRIPKEKQDTKLSEKLIAEWPGILRWMVEGCLRWQEKGILVPTAKIEAEVKVYRDEQNPAKRFIEANYIVGKATMFVSSTDLNRKREEWNSFGEMEITKVELDQFLRESGCTSGARRFGGVAVRGWIGLGERSQA